MENPDTRMVDHLNPLAEFKFDTTGYTDVAAPSKDRKQEFLDQGYVVIHEDEGDLILVGKKVEPVKEEAPAVEAPALEAQAPTLSQDA